MDATSSSTVTRGIRVTVRSQFIPEYSNAMAERYVFAYTVTIGNESGQLVQLRSRHWIVTHGDGEIEEVRGPGVVGEQPVLRPGEGFEYTSGCVLRTPRGSMRGSYQMVNHEGDVFEVRIGKFSLEMPYSLN
jgi:ApaG protein